MLEMKWHTSASGKRGAVSKQPDSLRRAEVGYAALQGLHLRNGQASGTHLQSPESLRKELVGSKLLVIFCTWLESLLPKRVKEPIRLTNGRCSNDGAGEPTHRTHGTGSPCSSSVQAGA